MTTGARGYGDPEGFGAQAVRKLAARRARKARRLAERPARRAAEKGRRPTVAERRAEVRKLRGGEAGLLKPLVVDRASQLVLTEQRRRDLSARTLKSGAVTIRRCPSGIARTPVAQELAAAAALGGQLRALHGPGLLAMVKELKTAMRERARENAEKVVVGRTYEWLKHGPVEVVKKSSSKVVVGWQGRLRKVSALQLVVDPRYVPGTMRVGRTELKNALREEFEIERAPRPAIINPTGDSKAERQRVVDAERERRRVCGVVRQTLKPEGDAIKAKPLTDAEFYARLDQIVRLTPEQERKRAALKRQARRG
jgi:hypothetical protein